MADNEKEPTGQEPDATDEADGQEPEADAKTPPWGDDFDPKRAWTLIENLRGEVDEMKAKRNKAKDAATEAERKAREAEEAKLAENEEYKTLAEKRAERLLELEPLEPKVKELEADRDRYRDALQRHVDEITKDIPEHVKELLKDRSPIEVMDYVTKHGETFRKHSADGPPDTPSPNGDRSKLDEEQRREGQRNARDLVRTAF